MGLTPNSAIGSRAEVRGETRLSIDSVVTYRALTVGPDARLSYGLWSHPRQAKVSAARRLDSAVGQVVSVA